MASLSDYAESNLLDHLLGVSPFTAPSGHELALYTSAPSDAGGGTEVSGNGYARQAITFGATSSPGGVSSNTGAVSFTAAGGNWGTITHAGIFDGLGNLLLHTPLTTSRVVNDGDTLTFAVGTVAVTID